MNNTIKVSLRFSIGEQLKLGLGDITIGKYTFYPLPSEPSDDFKTELLLNFNDAWDEGQQGSNPEREGKIILSWLSVILRQKLKAISFRLNNVQISNIKKETISFESPVDFPENLPDLYASFKSLPLETLERYVRSCECYQEALLLSNTNQTISFFLLVVCIECLSAKDYDFYEYLMKELDKDEISKKEITDIYNNFKGEYGLKSNFIQFILSNYEEWKIDFTEKEFKDILSSIYQIRSLFTHKGENFAKYIQLIDNRLKSKSVFTKIGDKNLEFPGLNYLSSLVRTVLINYLKKQKSFEVDNIPKLALKDSMVNLTLARDETIQKGSFITKSKIKHRD